MKDKCIKAVTEAAGRALSAVELKDIEDRIARNRRQLARNDRDAYLTMTPDQQLREAAKLASDEFVADALKDKQRVALTIEKHSKIDTYLQQQKQLHGMNDIESLNRVLAVFSDGKSFNSKSAITESVESRSQAISSDYIRQLHDAFAALSPKYIGLFQNKASTNALIRGLFGEDINGLVDPKMAAEIKGAVEAWNEVIELARTHFNNAGGKIGKIEDWRMPQSHSQLKIATAGQEGWVKDMMGWYNHKKYMNEDGSYMSAEKVQSILSASWKTLATNGANKMEPGKRNARILANEYSKRRIIHFKDADSYIAYQQKYGNTDTYTAMMKQIQSLSADLATVEIFGPNSDQTFRYFLDKAYKEQSIADPVNEGSIKAQMGKAQSLYDYITGKTQPVANWKIAQGFDTLRNWKVATQLGTSYVASTVDNATMHLTAQVNGMSSMRMMRNQLSTLNLANRSELQMARRAGLSLQTLIGEMNRWGAENLGASFSNKMANLTIRASLLNAATEARRRAFGVTMFGSIGEVANKYNDITLIDGADRRLLESKGVNDKIFQVWKRAQLEDWGNGNNTMLTPDAIYAIPDDILKDIGNPQVLRREAALKLLSMTHEEINMAVVEPGARTRELTKMGTQAGTLKGEIMRSFFLFKSFPLANVMKHWERAFGYEGKASKAFYLTGFFAGTTLFGAAAQQIGNIITGKDPQDMSKGKFWAGAIVKGGSGGIIGDFLFNTDASYGKSPLSALSGPIASFAEDLAGLTQGNVVQLLQGKKTNAAGEGIKFLKGNIPLQNLWYTKAATDRLIFNQLQEMVSPGYMNRVEQRARKETGQSYFYKPNEAIPHRAPDLNKAFGQ